MAVTEEALLDVIAAELGVSRTELDPGAAIGELDIDSLDLASLQLAIERRCGVEIGQDDLKGARTLGEALDVIVAKANAAS